MMRSESPYDRLGAAQPDLRSVRRVAIQGDPTAFLMAHRHLGEWRVWRELLDASGGISPFALRGADHTPSQRLTRMFPLDAHPDAAALVDLTSALGFGLMCSFISPELEGEGALVVEDIAAGSYTLALLAPGETSLGPALSLHDEDWRGADGEEIDVRALLYSGGYAIDLTLSRDLWLVLWLGRTTPLTFTPLPERDALILPGVTLG